MSRQWYCESDGQVQGLVSSAELMEMAQAGRISRETRVRQEGRQTWSVAREINGPFRYASPATEKPSPLPKPVQPKQEARQGNLIECPDFRQQISRHALACPHCGRPMKMAVQRQRRLHSRVWDFLGD